MKKVMLIGTVLAVLGGACGGSDGGAEDPTDSSSVVEATRTAQQDETITVAPEPGENGPEDQPSRAEGATSTTSPSGTPSTLQEEPIPTPEPAEEAVPEMTPDSYHSNPTAAAAIGDLVDRVGADPSEIVVVSVEAVTWRDGSLGCPQPGMSYAQVLTSGTRVVLEYGGIEFNYHAGRDGQPFYCATPTEPLGSEDPPPSDQ